MLRVSATPAASHFLRPTRPFNPDIELSTCLTSGTSFFAIVLRVASSAAFSLASRHFSKLDKGPRSFSSFWKFWRFTSYRSFNDSLRARPRSRTAAMWLCSSGWTGSHAARASARLGGRMVASPTQRSLASWYSSCCWSLGVSYFSSKSAGLRSEMSSPVPAAPLTSHVLGASSLCFAWCFMVLEIVGLVRCDRLSSNRARGVLVLRAVKLPFTLLSPVLDSDHEGTIRGLVTSAGKWFPTWKRFRRSLLKAQRSS
mmetsp:Transcript_136828/g.381421  ORF Transcript_136828/g.381421 Transcript_136828/m.381421 type:complete len:256 (+) Transcript_136828:77-844(+)